jgi:hypothetical protein
VKPELRAGKQKNNGWTNKTEEGIGNSSPPRPQRALRKTKKTYAGFGGKGEGIFVIFLAQPAYYFC